MADLGVEAGGDAPPQLLITNQTSTEIKSDCMIEDVCNSDQVYINKSELAENTIKNCDKEFKTLSINEDSKVEEEVDGRDREATILVDDEGGGDGACGGGGGIGFTLGAESKNEIMDSLAFTLQHSENLGSNFPDLDQERFFKSSNFSFNP